MRLPNYMNNDQMVDDILKTHTYEQIREKVNQIMRVKMIIDRTASQAKSMGKHNEGYSLESASKEQLSKLTKLSDASKKYILSQARAGNQFYEMDLHGLFWEEAREVVTEQVNYIWQMINENEHKCKFQEKIKDGQRFCKYSIITGKGLHSKNNKPVLYNNLSQFLDEKGIINEPLKNEGKIVVYIQI